MKNVSYKELLTVELYKYSLAVIFITRIWNILIYRIFQLTNELILDQDDIKQPIFLSLAY